MSAEESLTEMPEPRPAVLILHGFTGYLATVQALADEAENRGLAWRMPVLRGHGTRPEDLVGVTWQDWYQDAETSLQALVSQGRPVVCMGLSMGALLALDLAGRHPDLVRGVVTIAPAIEIASPLLPLLPWVAPFMPWVQGGKPPRSAQPAELSPGRRAGLACPSTYPRFPTRTLMSLVDYSARLRGRLGLVTADLLVVMSRADKAVRPRGADRIAREVRSGHRELLWYQDLPHDMLLPPYGGEVAERVFDWCERRFPHGT